MSARLFIFGLWAIVLGLLMLVIFVQLFEAWTTSASMTGLGAQTAISVDAVVMDTLYLLYRGGVITLGLGGLMTFVGSAIIVRVSR